MSVPNSDQIEAARELLAQACNVEISTIPVDATIEDTECWDSFAHVNLMLSIEEALGCQLTSEVMLTIESVDEIAVVLAGR